ncbi:uncharacterized protein BXZ73DRAFT_87366 [Epithele typhae]|uniref:uncharacterized protein n=1 Tax=Epithele typhae TaxID=378194 RepID=UPI0020075D01|nr:uncharacterized protein BXZ73DRAFT_87366 [Epithele typhae]KAH9944481.1 hypothetical protein BXZ73DRAFT_87366 [Epithele typhae]
MTSDEPPTYTQEPSEADAPLSDDSDDLSFIVVIPVAEGGVSFQKGFLGADNEHAAVEGELQIKTAQAGFRWQKVTVGLKSVEKTQAREIELAHTEQILAATPDPSPQQRSSFPFAIPLPADTPQCIHTARSSLTHILTASVIPLDEGIPPLRRSYFVHTRRYTSHTHDLHPAPETWTMAEPSEVEVQLPRTTFKAGEPLPIYITVPTPSADLVVEHGLRLRNLRAELVRAIHTKDDDAGSHNLADADFTALPDDDEGEPSTPSQKRPPPIPSTSRQAPDFQPMEKEHGERKVVALSGASCRLHPSRPLRIRLVLHPPTDSPRPGSPHGLPSDELSSAELDTDCASITQSTPLHSVSFRLLVHATFMNMSNHTERVSTQHIPLFIIPPSAPLPEVEPSHDQPPSRTYSEAAPPPFEEREAPPPFFTSEAEASTSTRLPTFLESEASTSRLPTFLESEQEIYVPPDEDLNIVAPSTSALAQMRELFGFVSADQFDGYADAPPQRSDTPPPSLEMATHDANVTGLATMAPAEADAAIEALGLALDQQNIARRNSESASVHGHDVDDPLPPPPPPMDDPSDPPPSIDSEEFRAPGAAVAHDSPPRTQSPPVPRGAAPRNHGHAPPPYRVPDIGHDEHGDHERVVHPPPYMDLVHE